MHVPAQSTSSNPLSCASDCCAEAWFVVRLGHFASTDITGSLPGGGATAVAGGQADVRPTGVGAPGVGNVVIKGAAEDVAAGNSNLNSMTSSVRNGFVGAVAFGMFVVILSAAFG